MWFKLVTRRLGIQIGMAWNHGFGNLMRKKYGVGIDDTLIFSDGEKTDYYVDLKQWEEFEKGIFRLLERDSFVTTLPWKAKEFLENLLKEVNALLETDLQGLNKEELCELYEKIVEKNNVWYTRMWMVFLSNEPIAQAVQKELEKTIDDEKKVSKLLLDFSSPLEMNDVLNERMDALELAIERTGLTDAEFEKKLLMHSEKYRHIPMFDFNHEPYSPEHFEKEINGMKNPIEEKKKLEKTFSERRGKFEEQLKSLNLSEDSRLLKLILLLKQTVFVRDYRDMLRQKLNLSLRKLYSEIANRMGVTTEQAAYLTNQEITDFLNGKMNALQIRNEIEEREKCFLLIQRKNKIEIYSGETAKQKAMAEIGLRKLQNLEEISGISASRGFATGIARIVHTNLDLKKIKEGDVMIAHMTRQDYVPFMRKCKGFVTDEGGITSHTAIIARELELPCIVGTHIATQVFKDGDKIEIDATKGKAKKMKG